MENAKKEKEGLSLPLLILSIIASIFIWRFLFGNLAFALTLIASILIHEYGHYWWMGREGIKKRDMFMIPPFGAVARSKEGWGSYAAEAKIALAGPAFGLLSLVLFVLLLNITQDLLWVLALVVAASINFFNLLPIAILDGGRTIKSIVVSINPAFLNIFQVFAVIFIGLLTFFISPIMGVILFFFWFMEVNSTTRLKNIFPGIDQLVSEWNVIKSYLPNMGDYFPALNKLREDHEKTREQILKLLNRPYMNGKEIAQSLRIYFLLITAYLAVILLLKDRFGVSVFNFFIYLR